MSETPNIPVVRVRLGDSLADLRRQSSYRFNFDRLQDDDLVAVDQPLRFGFAGEDGFDLPPTRFASFNCIAALVVVIDVALHIEYLAIAQAMQVAGEVGRLLQDHRWLSQASDPRVVGINELSLRLADPVQGTRSSWTLASYEKANAAAVLNLRRAHRAGRLADHDLFMLNIQCRDDVLGERAQRVVQTLRRADGLPPQRARGVVLETYLERVRRQMPA